jgi:hypothetical protein
VPLLDIERSHFLQKLRANVRSDLVLDELPVPLRRPRANIARCFPMVDAGAYPLGNGDFVRLDVFSLSDGSY